MQYNNPIEIFNSTQILRLNSGSLESLKSELMAHFQSSESATFEKDGIIYSKKEVSEIFNTLQNNLDLHLKIHHHKSLLAFLQKGDLQFFSNKSDIAQITNDLAYKEAIDKYISNKLNTQTYDLIDQFDKNSLVHLENIQGYTNQMNAAHQKEAYATTYVKLEKFIKQLPKDHPQPFAGPTGLQLHSEIHNKINAQLYNCFKYLPDNFKDLSYLYGVWCHNDVVNTAFKREQKFQNYERKDLLTLFRAMQIGSKVTKSESFKENTATVKQYLMSKSSTKVDTSTATAPSSGGGMTALKVISFFLMICWVGVKCARIVKNTSQIASNKSSNRTNSPSIEDILKQQKRNSENAANLDKKLTLQRYTGDQIDLWNNKYIKSKEHEVYEALNIEVGTFPTAYADFEQLIPQDKIRKYVKQKEQQFVFIFTNPDFPNIKMRHRVKAKFGNLQMNAVKYDGLKNKSKKDKVKLTTKRFSTKNGKLKGTISRYDHLKSEPISKEKFSIEYVKSEYERLKAEQKLDLGGPYDKYQPYRIRGIEDNNLKNVILNNLSIVHNKQLKLGNYYTLKDAATYIPSSGKTPIQFSVNSVEEKKGSLSFSHISSEDEIGICTLNGKEFQIRYFVSKETKKVIGMHMVVQNDVSKQMEVIEVFYQ